MYMHTSGLRLSSWDALPDSMKQEIATHYPDYTAPPALDDSRPNVTSWIYYRRRARGLGESAGTLGGAPAPRSVVCLPPSGCPNGHAPRCPGPA